MSRQIISVAGETTATAGSNVRTRARSARIPTVVDAASSSQLDLFEAEPGVIKKLTADAGFHASPALPLKNVEMGMVSAFLPTTRSPLV